MELTEKEIKDYKRCIGLIDRSARLILKSIPLLVTMGVEKEYFISEAERYIKGLDKLRNMLNGICLETTGFPEICKDGIMIYVEEINNFLCRVLLFKDFCLN